MNLRELATQMVPGSIILMVFALGLRATRQNATYMLRHPRYLLKSFFAMNIAMLVVAVFIARAFVLHPAVELALVVIALSPVPPFLPLKQLKAGGDPSYIYELLVGMALLAIVAIPILVPMVGRLFNLDTHVAPSAIGKVLLMTVLLPIGAGTLIQAWKPELAERIAKLVSPLSAVMLMVASIVILASAWSAIISLIGDGTIMALTAFVIIGLLVGHLLGENRLEHQSSLALATASRHPAVALVIAHAALPGQKLVTAAVLLYLIVSVVISGIYLNWHKHHRGTLGKRKEEYRYGLGET